MKHAPLLAFGLALLCVVPLQAAELQRAPVQPNDSPDRVVPPSAVEFAKVIDDLPLMPGLQLVEDDDVLFTEPKAGRIAETTAEGEVDIDDMYMFYRRSLPQLGWKPLDTRRYIRDSEILRIEAHAGGRVTRVEFSVTPAGK